jgi:hypothetical protein
VQHQGAEAGAGRRVDDEDVARLADPDLTDLVFQHGQILADIEADEEHAHHLAGRVAHGVVLGDVLLAK